MRERQKQDPAFRFRGAGQRQQILQRLFVWAVRGRLLRRRLLRLQLKPHQARQALEREYPCTYGGTVPFGTCESGWGAPALRASGKTPAQTGS